MRCYYADEVSIPTKMYDLVHDKVKSGMYSNASEVVRDVLRMFVAPIKTFQLPIFNCRQICESRKKCSINIILTL